jgi:lipopolysaccharide export system permease protein|tara:strand:- start:3645 stop:4802 length:1158 start_codon:yes stop_codon:yes gene_type:complete
MHHSSQGMYKKNILSKSLNMEVLKSSLSILLIFFLLVVGSRVVSYFEQAAEGYLDPSIIMSVVALRFPDFITLLIPLSFFLGVLITVSRLYAEREIYGFFSIGLAPIDLVRFLAPQAIIYFVLTLLLSLYIAPYTKSLSQELLSIDSFEEQIDSLQSKRLFSLKDGNGFIYVEDAENGSLKGIKLFQPNKENSFLVLADELIVKENGANLDLKFLDGSLYKGIFSNSSQLVSTFGEFKLSLDGEASKGSEVSLSKIFDYSSSSDNASLQWSISIPITIIILLFMGVYMGAVKPRQGRFSVILPGMLVYVMYLSLLIYGRESISDNSISSIGLWWVHLLFCLFLLCYIFRDKISFHNSTAVSIRENTYLKYSTGFILFLLLLWLII